MGSSQRHDGRYGAGFRLESTDAARDTLAIRQSHVRVEGLSVRSFPGTSRAAIFVSSETTDIDVWVTHCVADGNGSSETNGIIHFEALAAGASGVFRDANNIVYGAPTGYSECLWHRNGPDATAWFYPDFRNSALFRPDLAAVGRCNPLNGRRWAAEVGLNCFVVPTLVVDPTEVFFSIWVIRAEAALSQEVGL